MLKNAPIFLDEAAANVAPENGKKLMDAIEALTREKTDGREPPAIAFFPALGV